MFEMLEFRLLLETYHTIFSDILGNMKLEKMEDKKVIFKNKKNEYLVATILDNCVDFKYENDDIEKHTIFNIPNKNDELPIIEVLEIIKESRENGCIIERVEKKYGYSIYISNDRVLTDLVSKRYVLENGFDDINMEDEQFLEEHSKLLTTFESHMNYYVKTPLDTRYTKFSKYSSLTLLNGRDISDLYDIIVGSDKIIKIYDLYNGIINNRNTYDVFCIHLGTVKKECFGYKETSGITEEENKICGSLRNKIPYNQDCDAINYLIRNRIRYEGEFDCGNLESLIGAITYDTKLQDMTTVEIERNVGISYDEPEHLDSDEQDNPIDRKKMKYDNKLHIDEAPGKYILTGRKVLDNISNKLVKIKKMVKRGNK